MNTHKLVTFESIENGSVFITDTHEQYKSDTTPHREGGFLHIQRVRGSEVYIHESLFSENGEVRALLFNVSGDWANLYRVTVNVSAIRKLRSYDFAQEVYNLDAEETVYVTQQIFHKLDDADMITRPYDRSGYVMGNRSDLYESEDGNYFVSECRRDEHDERQRNDPNNYREHYHAGSGIVHYHRFGLETPKYVVGLEFEKEDGDVLRSIPIDDFRQRFPKWRKESDSSLDNWTGYELVSPGFELDPDKIVEYIKADDILRAHVEAGGSRACGMHANVSDNERTPWEIFDDLYGYLPVLSALYPFRVDNTFCRAKTKVAMVRDNEKRQAFCIKSDRVEIRIFGRATNLDNLRFRLRLIRYMMENPAPNFRAVNMDGLREILDTIHKTEDQRKRFAERVNEYAQRFRA